MKNPNRETNDKLEALPNVGPATAGDLHLLGIHHPRDLIGKDPVHLYSQLESKTGVRQDPCVLDVFMSIIDFMEGGEAKPWWYFTEQRKRLL